MDIQSDTTYWDLEDTQPMPASAAAAVAHPSSLRRL